MSPTPDEPRYWRSNLRMTAGLLAVWFVGTFGSVYFARDLDFELFGWPFSFWMGAQGALLIYCAITWGYAHYMDRLDAEEGATPAGDPQAPGKS